MKNNDLEKARRYFQICFELRNKLKEMQASDTLWAQIISKKKEKGIQGEEQRYQAVIAILDILNNSETEEEIVKKNKCALTDDSEIQGKIIRGRHCF